MSDGVFRKFEVKRTDGSSEPGRKHADCSYFVLDLEHDPFAIPALRAYARACAKTHPDLARDLRYVANTPKPRPCGCREAFCPHTPAWPTGPSQTMEQLIREAKDRK